ncbi:MAG: hypothetical protein M1582_01265 [Actinobacteria bacterium]|nr:hypothetical protein [Actinomycetota bacterium]
MPPAQELPTWRGRIPLETPEGVTPGVDTIRRWMWDAYGPEEVDPEDLTTWDMPVWAFPVPQAPLANRNPELYKPFYRQPQRFFKELPGYELPTRYQVEPLRAEQELEQLLEDRREQRLGPIERLTEALQGLGRRFLGGAPSTREGNWDKRDRLPPQDEGPILSGIGEEAPLWEWNYNINSGSWSRPGEPAPTDDTQLTLPGLDLADLVDSPADGAGRPFEPASTLPIR